MDVALVGYGGMGRELAQLASDLNLSVKAIIDPLYTRADHSRPSPSALKEVDLAIDFTTPRVVVDTIRVYCECVTPAVIGTTGWYDEMDSVREHVHNSTGRILWGSNFSIGVNLFFRLVEAGTKLFARFEEYDVWGHEMHHVNKLDAPSGTAETLSDIVLEHSPKKEQVVFDRVNRRIEPHEFHFSSLRAGAMNFEHSIGFDSAADTVTIKHSARNRSGYARGALLAAKWLMDQPQGFYSLDDFFADFGAI